MPNTTTKSGYRARATHERCQPHLWYGCPWDDINRPGGPKGVKFELDVMNFPDLTGYGSAGTAETELQYAYYFDTGGTIKQADTPFGGVAMFLDASGANDENWLQFGGNAGTSFTINDPINGAAGFTDPFDIFLDFRFKVSSVVDDVMAVFLGLADNGRAVADTKVDTTGLMVDDDWIGFQTVHTNGGTTGTNAVLMFSYKKASGTVQIPIASLATLVADTEIAVGYTHRQVNPTTRRISVWKNNVRQATGVSDANIQAASFPDGISMSPLFGCKKGSSAAGGTFTILYARGAMVKWGGG